VTRGPALERWVGTIPPVEAKMALFNAELKKSREIETRGVMIALLPVVVGLRQGREGSARVCRGY